VRDVDEVGCRVDGSEAEVLSADVHVRGGLSTAGGNGGVAGGAVDDRDGAVAGVDGVDGVDGLVDGQAFQVAGVADGDGGRRLAAAGDHRAVAGRAVDHGHGAGGAGVQGVDGVGGLVDGYG